MMGSCFGSTEKACRLLEDQIKSEESRCIALKQKMAGLEKEKTAAVREVQRTRKRNPIVNRRAEQAIRAFNNAQAEVKTSIDDIALFSSQLRALRAANNVKDKHKNMKTINSAMRSVRTNVNDIENTVEQATDNHEDLREAEIALNQFTESVQMDDKLAAERDLDGNMDLLDAELAMLEEEDALEAEELAEQQELQEAATEIKSPTSLRNGTRKTKVKTAEDYLAELDAHPIHSGRRGNGGAAGAAASGRTNGKLRAPAARMSASEVRKDAVRRFMKRAQEHKEDLDEDGDTETHSGSNAAAVVSVDALELEELMGGHTNDSESTHLLPVQY